MIALFHTFLVDPIYNIFVFLIGVIPGGDVGVAIIILTLLMRVVFYPAFASSIRTQMAMQAVQPELTQINERYKDDREEKARRQMELFKKHRIHPLSMVGTSLVQVVFYIALSYVFFRIGLPNIRTDLLYSFISPPAIVNEHFLGLLDLTLSHSVQNALMAVVVAGLQFAVMKLSLARTISTAAVSAEKQMVQNMQKQMMLYMFPVMMAVLTFTFPAALGLYIGTTNLVSLGQEWLIRRKPL